MAKGKVKVIAGWIMFTGSLIAWPITLYTTNEPKFILSLSWFAIVIEAWNMTQIANVENKENPKE